MKIRINKAHTSAYLLALLGILGLSSCSYDDGYRIEKEVDSSLLPVADFSASETTIDQDMTVNFTDESTGEPYLYSWEFEGGNPTKSSEKSPSVQYPIPGKFKVYLKVRNDYGAAEIVKEEYITVESTGEPLDPSIAVRMNFENSLLNEGYTGGEGVSSAPSYGEAFVGEASYLFDGTNAITITEYKGINGKEPRTVSAYIKTTSSDRETITHWGAQAIGSRASFVMNGNGTIRFEVAGGGINGATAINNGEWHHIAYTYDGSTVKMYVDGVLDASWETDIIDTGVGGETEVEIGSQLGNNIFNGQMDDFRIYDKVLSKGEIGTLMADNAATISLNFESSLINEGTFGSEAVSTGEPTFEAGIIGGLAYSFNGVDYLTIPGYKGISGNGGRTIMAWIKTSNTATQGLVHWGASGSFSRSSFKVNNSGEIRFEWQGGNMIGSTNITDGEWHHVALSYDGATATLFVDGIVEETQDVVLDSNNAGEIDVTIGSQAGGAIFQGLLDDVRIFEKALSNETIQVISDLD